MERNNKKRILRLIEVLKKNSDENKHLKIDEIIPLLNQKGIKVDNRKTLYDDFKVLNECDINIEYDDGYYLLESPFNLSEIKIIQDSIYSLKSVDNSLLEKLNSKLYTFISNDEEKLLDSLKYTNKHKDKKFFQKMEDVLLAIKTNKAIIVKRKNNKQEEVFPIFLHRDNDYYYLYYHYENKEKIYHYRFDNIFSIQINDKVDNMTINKKKIIEKIETSTNSFSSGDINTIQIEIIKQSDTIKERIENDFPNVIFTKEGFNIKTSINPNFYSKLLGYGKDIRIKDKKIAQDYLSYLKDIIDNY